MGAQEGPVLFFCCLDLLLTMLAWKKETDYDETPNDLKRTTLVQSVLTVVGAGVWIRERVRADDRSAAHRQRQIGSVRDQRHRIDEKAALQIPSRFSLLPPFSSPVVLCVRVGISVNRKKSTSLLTSIAHARGKLGRI